MQKMFQSPVLWQVCTTETEAKGECISCAPNDVIVQNMCISLPEGLDVYSVKDTWKYSVPITTAETAPK